MDKEEKRIAKALGTQEVPEVDEGNLLKYRKYLLEQMDKGTVLTGREDFPWEDVKEALSYHLQGSGLTVEGLLDDPRGLFWGEKDLVKRYYFRRVGFPTPSGKVEIASEKLRKLGYDPLPVYHEPAETPVSQPELAKE